MKIDVDVRRGRMYTIASKSEQDGNFIGQVRTVNGAYYDLHWTSWQSRVPGLGPVLGQMVEALFNSRGEFLGARPVEEKDNGKTSLKVEIDLAKYPEHARLRAARESNKFIVDFFELMAEKGWTIKDRIDDEVGMNEVLCAQHGISESALRQERDTLQQEALLALMKTVSE